MRSRRYYIVRGAVRVFFYLAVLFSVIAFMAGYAYLVNNYLGI